MKAVEERVMELDLSKINTTVAASVRATVQQEAVDRYAEAYEQGEELPPVDVYAGGNVYYLADGGHRYKAVSKIGRKTIKALVRQCATEQEAHAAAVLHAAGANALHGLPRSPEDKRAAVRSVIGRPEYADASDSAIADICRVSHVLVRLVREQMTAQGLLSGPASATARPYKQGAKLRGGAEADGKGGIVASVIKQESASSNPVARPEETSAPPPNSVGVRDSRGRAVPAKLVESFRRGKELLLAVREAMNQVQATIRQAVTNCGGEALPAVVHLIDSEIASVIENVSSAIPYACCPHLADDGSHRQGRTCRVCGGRGWVSRHVWRQMPDTLRALCDSQSSTTAQEDTAC